MNQELYTFWRYSSGPGSFRKCLGGKVVKFIDKDIVKVENYGGGCFRYFIVMPLEQGIEIQRDLDELENLYSHEYKALNEKYQKLHDEILKVPNG